MMDKIDDIATKKPLVMQGVFLLAIVALLLSHKFSVEAMIE
jgi:hypothetical protein